MLPFPILHLPVVVAKKPPNATHAHPTKKYNKKRKRPCSWVCETFKKEVCENQLQLTIGWRSTSKDNPLKTSASPATKVFPSCKFTFLFMVLTNRIPYPISTHIYSYTRTREFLQKTRISLLFSQYCSPLARPFWLVHATPQNSYLIYKVFIYRSLYYNILIHNTHISILAHSTLKTRIAFRYFNSHLHSAIFANQRSSLNAPSDARS